MRYFGVLGTVALTELMAHFLSLGWGLMTLLAAFAWVALSGASTAAKARSTEDRLTALIPTVFPRTGGTISGSVTVTGNHAVSGQVSANTLSVSGNASTGGSHTVNGTLTASSGVLAASLHSTGNVQVDGAHTVNGTLTTFSGIEGASSHVTGNAQVDGQVSTYQLYVNGSRLNMVQSAGGWPMSSGQAWGPSVVNVLNQLKSALDNSNVTN